MFESIEKATQTEIANSAIHDVTEVPPSLADRMESFFLAETLKYFFLIFSEPELVSLDDYVLYVLLPASFLRNYRYLRNAGSAPSLLTWWLHLCRNTEAHPFKRGI